MHTSNLSCFFSARSCSSKPTLQPFLIVEDYDKNIIVTLFWIDLGLTHWRHMTQQKRAGVIKLTYTPIHSSSIGPLRL